MYKIDAETQEENVMEENHSENREIWVPGPLGEPILISSLPVEKTSKLANALIVALALVCFGFVAYVFVKHGGL
jgi:hypothetical protein